MKKLTLMVFAAGLFAFTSCSSDDDGNGDGGGVSSNCQTYTTSFEGAESVAEYCDNGDGTYTVKNEAGEEITQDIPGEKTFDDIIANLELTGNCE